MINYSLIFYLKLSFLFILGSFFGSFINCLSYRYINSLDFIYSRSICENCGHKLNVSDLIPVFSYLLRKGKCKYCGKPIDKSHLLIEIITGIVFVLLFIKNKYLNYLYLKDIILSLILIGLSIIDIKSYIIPDGFIIGGIINYLFFEFDDIYLDLIRAFIISVFIYLLVIIMNKNNHKDNMGMGDIKLIFMISHYFDAYKVLIIILLASILGLIEILIHKRNKIPFGPFIAIACIITLTLL